MHISCHYVINFVDMATHYYCVGVSQTEQTHATTKIWKGMVTVTCVI